MSSLKEWMDKWLEEICEEIRLRAEAADSLSALPTDTYYELEETNHPTFDFPDVGRVSVSIARKRIHPFVPWVDFDLEPFNYLAWCDENEGFLHPGCAPLGSIRVAGDLERDEFIKAAVRSLRRMVEHIKDIDAIHVAGDTACAVFETWERWKAPESPWNRSRCLLRYPEDPVIEMSVWDTKGAAVDQGFDLAIPLDVLRGSAWFRERQWLLDRLWSSPEEENWYEEYGLLDPEATLGRDGNFSWTRSHPS